MSTTNPLTQWRVSLDRWQRDGLQRFHKLAKRDQQALVLLSGFLLLLVLVYGLIIPAMDYRQQARQSFSQEQQLLAWMKAQGPAVAALQQSGQAAGSAQQPAENPITLVNNSARDYKLSIKRLQPESNGSLRVWMEHVSFNNTIQWLEYIQQRGLSVDDISITQEADGIVNVRANFK